MFPILPRRVSVRRSNGPEGIAMNKDQIVSAVRESASIDTRERAEKAVRATLRVLGQRLAGEASDLAAQLPPELAEELLASEGPQRFDSQEFYRRVAAEEGSGCTEQEARQHARAVTAALREAVGAEYPHLLDQLPEDDSDLMHTENVQH
jgi:uncharacterized protein (DUF2267 family)